jgi:hypothetical protein
MGMKEVQSLKPAQKCPSFEKMRQNIYANNDLMSFFNTKNSKDNIQDKFNYGDSNPKNLDQTYLTDKVWPIASKNATIHDAYNCKFLGGEAFPTQRPPNLYCFISCFFPCCKEIYNQTQRMAICPQECRPKNHPEWDRC